MNLEVEYTARLREFLRPTGNLRKCRPSCMFPDTNHEIRCPERNPDAPRGLPARK